MSGRKVCLKVLLLGNSRVGKSSIKLRLTQGTFSSNYVATVGADVQTQTIKVKDHEVHMQIWDPSGSEQFRELTKQYFHDSDCCILVFDLTDQTSMFGVCDWLHAFVERMKPSKGFPLLVLGNKSDLITKQQPMHRDIRNWSDGKDIPYMEVSAKDNMGIKTVFEFMAKACINNEDEFEFL